MQTDADAGTASRGAAAHLQPRGLRGAGAGGAGRAWPSRCSSGALTRRLLRAIEGERFHTQAIADATVKAVRRVTFVLSLLVLVVPALDLAGVELTVGLHPEDVTRWLTRSGARLLLLFLLAFAANRFAGVGDPARRAGNRRAATTSGLIERRKRAQTVGATVAAVLLDPDLDAPRR